jgi:hypothetical protein
MKPTLRQNDEHMVTLNISHHVNGEAIAIALVLRYVGTLEALPKRLTKGQIEKAIRDRLAIHGDSGFEFWQERIPVESIDSGWDWAREQVHHHWPQMITDMPEPVDPQTFTWVRWTWDIDEALRLHGHRASVPVKISGLAGLLGMGVITVDPAHFPKVDLSKPLLIAPFPNTEGHLPIDGWHRIGRALQEGIDELPGIILTEAESAAVRTTH